MLKTSILATGSILLCSAFVFPQEKPLSVQGTFSTGFYNSYTRGGGNESQSVQFVPATAMFDINSYYMTPDLLKIWVQPQFSASPQASDAGFLGGNGIQTRVNMFRRSSFPMTFRYSNVQLEDVYFGSLSRLSSFTLENRTKDLGFTSEFHRAGLPNVTLDWGTDSVRSKSSIATLADYQSSAEHVNVDSNYVRWGWEFHGFAHRRQMTSDLVTVSGEGANSAALDQKVAQYQASARRGLPRDSELYVEAGSQSTCYQLLNRPNDLFTRYANANLRLFQRGRWKVSLRAGYNSNLASLLFTQLAGGLGGRGSITPDTGTLGLLQHTISNLNLNALTSVDISHGFRLYSSLDRMAISTDANNGFRSSYLTLAGGILYAGSFRWGNLSGQYGREFGNGSITGQTGSLEGQDYALTVQHGNRDRLQLAFSVHGTDQSVRNEQPADSHSFAADASIGRNISGQISVQAGGGWQQSAFTTSGSDFRNKGYTGHIGIEHPRFQLNGSLNSSIGNSLQAYSQLFGGIGAEAAILTPLRLIPSDFRGLTVSLHANPTAKFELSGIWTRSVQRLEGLVANDFEIIDVRANYRYRLLHFELGFFRSRQIFSSYLATYPETERGRVYFRVFRTTNIL